MAVSSNQSTQHTDTPPRVET